MPGLADLVIKKRMEFLKKINTELLSICVSSDFEPLNVWKGLMCIDSNSSDHKDLMQEVFERNKTQDYYKKLAEKIEDVTDFHELLRHGVFSETHYYNDTIMGNLYKMLSFVDETFSVFVGTLEAFPWYYEKYGTNCLGTSLVYASLLYMKDKEKFDKAKFVEVYNTKRRENLIKALTMLENDEYSQASEEDIKEFIERIDNPSDYYGDKILILPNPVSDYVSVDVDTIHGFYKKDDVKEMIANSILTLESKIHGIIKVDEKYIDFPLEWMNIKGKNEYKIDDGLFLHTYLNLLNMFGNCQFDVKREFEKLYSNDEFRKSVQLNIMGWDLGVNECKEYVLERYGDDLPIYLKARLYKEKGFDPKEALNDLPKTLSKIAEEIYRI